MTIRGYLVYVPFEAVASIEYGAPGDDEVMVARTPEELAGPFEVVQVIADEPVMQPCGPVANEMRARARAQQADVTPEAAPLLQVFLEDPSRPRQWRELVELTHLHPGRLRAALDHLEAAGLVRRGRDGIDPAGARPRWTHYTLTTEGAAAARMRE